jgi:hypothetical protein
MEGLSPLCPLHFKQADVTGSAYLFYQQGRLEPLIGCAGGYHTLRRPPVKTPRRGHGLSLATGQSASKFTDGAVMNR